MSVAELSLRANSFRERQHPVSPRPAGGGGAGASPGAPGAEDLQFDVGGTIYTMNRELIDRWPTSLLAELMTKFDKGELKGTRLDGFNQDPPQPMYLDRHPTAFSGIAKFYKTKGEVLEQPWTLSKDAWTAELRFFRLIGLGPTVDAAEAASLTLKQIGRPSKGHRRAMWDFLEDPRSSRLAKAFMVFGVLVIMTSILSLCLDTVYVLPHQTEIFTVLETSCILFFTAEYLLRLYATDGKLRFVKSTMNVIDLVAILPFYAGLFFGGVDGLSVVRVVRLVRIFRVFKFGASMRGLTVFKNTMVNSLDALLLLLFFVMLAVLLFGSVIFFSEHDEIRFDLPLKDGSARPRFCDHVSWKGCPACSGPGLPVCGGRQSDIVDDVLVEGTYDGTASTCEAVTGCVFVPAVEEACSGTPVYGGDCAADFKDQQGPRSACAHGCHYVAEVSALCLSQFEVHLASDAYATVPESCTGTATTGAERDCAKAFTGLSGQVACPAGCTYTPEVDRLGELQAHADGAQCPASEEFTRPLPPPWDRGGNGSGPPIFTSIPMGFWWTLCTMTSLGYGEIYPVTYVGRVVGGLASLAGLITLALPMVIIGQNFSDAYRVQSMVEEAASDAEEALIARREARAKMKFDEKFRKLRLGKKIGAFKRPGVTLVEAAPKPPAERESPPTSESPTAANIEEQLFPTPPKETPGDLAGGEAELAAELSAAELDASLYPVPEKAAAAAEATEEPKPALVPTPPAPREQD
jgi:hypothetical protein